MARKLQADKWLFAATAGLALFGIVMVYSASAMMAAQENGNQYYYVIKQAVWTLIGFGAMLVAMHFDYQRLRSRTIIYGLLALTVLMLVAVFGFSRVNGAHRWIKFAGFSIQPSEVSKLALALFLAYFFEKRAGSEDSFWRTFVPSIGVTGLLALLVVAEPDLGTAMMLTVVFVVISYTAGTRLLHLGMAAAPALLGLTALLIFVPWRLQRLITFLNPWADPQDKGFQVVQSLIAIGSGGTGGLGFAQGKQKLFFLPFAHSDFIFAVVGEELGRADGHRRLRPLPVARRARKPACARQVRNAARFRHRRRHRHAGALQHQRRAVARADKGHPAALHLLRRLVAGSDAGRRRHPAQHLAVRGLDERPGNDGDRAG
jgi:cell division protein FtsW